MGNPCHTDQTAHLLLLHLGPVQDWIAQARGTRDSWFGSHYLSEISKAAALAILEADGLLIFPSKDEATKLREALRPCDTPWYEHYYGVEDHQRIRLDTPAFNVSNKIVAEVRGDPAEIATLARSAANARWCQIVDRTLSSRRCKDLIREGCAALMDEQRDTLLEFFAVWGTLPARSYGQVFAELNRALNARKQLREFKPWEHDGPGHHRSSLDGARASILKKVPEEGKPGREQALKVRARLRIAEGEQLDAIGLAKRAGGGPDQFIPLVNVAMSAWIRQAHAVCPDALETLRLACEKLGRETDGGLGRVYRSKLEWVSFFDYDAHIFHPERWEILLKEMKARAIPTAPVMTMDKLEPWATQYVRPVLAGRPAPPSYVACIIADGDHMGETLKQPGGRSCLAVSLHRARCHHNRLWLRRTGSQRQTPLSGGVGGAQEEGGALRLASAPARTARADLADC